MTKAAGILLLALGILCATVFFQATNTPSGNLIYSSSPEDITESFTFSSLDGGGEIFYTYNPVSEQIRVEADYNHQGGVYELRLISASNGNSIPIPGTLDTNTLTSKGTWETTISADTTFEIFAMVQSSTGSGQFLLSSFDVEQVIYEQAPDNSGPGSTTSGPSDDELAEEPPIENNSTNADGTISSDESTTQEAPNEDPIVEDTSTQNNSTNASAGTSEPEPQDTPTTTPVVENETIINDSVNTIINTTTTVVEEPLVLNTSPTQNETLTTETTRDDGSNEVVEVTNTLKADTVQEQVTQDSSETTTIAANPIRSREEIRREAQAQRLQEIQKETQERTAAKIETINNEQLRDNIKEDLATFRAVDISTDTEIPIIKNIEVEEELDALIETPIVRDIFTRVENKEITKEIITQRKEEAQKSVKTTKKIVVQEKQPNEFTSTVVITVEPLKNRKTIQIVEVIPKEIAQSVSELSFNIEPIILEDDPVVMWHLENLSTKVELAYEVNKNISITGNTIALSQDSEPFDWLAPLPVLVIPIIAGLFIFFSRRKEEIT